MSDTTYTVLLGRGIAEEHPSEHDWARFEVIDRQGPANQWKRIAGEVLSTWIVSDELYPIGNPLPISDINLEGAGGVLVQLDGFNLVFAPQVGAVGSATVLNEPDSWEWKLEAVSD